jgi:DNA polymerase III delta' subunit
VSYQVLARKWRPRTFTELVGQEHVVRPLVHALDHGRVHHAFLFTGTRGVGKTTIARILAKSLNCERGVTSAPCGECTACREVDEGRFVDLIEVDAASRTKVDDTRELLDNVQYAPTRGRYKVYLIDEVHMLSGHSFNALLKTLEEPPDQVLLLLTSPTAEALLPTIVSRCETLVLRPLPVAELASQLRGRGLSQQQADLLAGITGGRPGRALTVAAAPEVMERRQQHLRDLWKLLGGTRNLRFDYVRKSLDAPELEGRRLQATELLETWLSVWRDALLLSHGGRVPTANPDQRQRVEWLAARVKREPLQRVLQRLDAVLEAVEANANLRLALEAFMLDLPFVAAPAGETDSG